MITASTNKSSNKLRVSISKPFIQCLFLVGLILQFSNCTKHSSSQENGIIQNNWHALETVDEDGLLGERVDLWRNKRLWYIAESAYLIDGFENRPGIHPWQGEHMGKWLHAATLAYHVTGDDVVNIDLDYQLNAHLQDGEEAKKWLAFAYGPLALKQKIQEMSNEEPFLNACSTEPPELLKMLHKKSGSETEFSIKGTEL